MMIIMGMIMLIGYTMMTMRGPKVINTWEKFTGVKPNPKTKKGSQGKRSKIAKEDLAMLKIILRSNKYAKGDDDNDDDEENFGKYKQKQNNRVNHSKYGNRVCKLMQINKGSSWFGKNCEQVMHEINEVNPSVINLCEANFPNNYKNSMVKYLNKFNVEETKAGSFTECTDGKEEHPL